MKMMFGSEGITHTDKYYLCYHCVFSNKSSVCAVAQCNSGVFIPVQIKTDVFNL